MDVAIQSQIQSPLVRALQSIPTNSANYVHSVPDNTPPFSRSSVKIEPYSSNPSSLNGEHKFRIPQGGHLSRLNLVYRMIGHTQFDGGVVDETASTDVDNVFQFADGIEWVQLRSHNNVIQTIHASSIPFEVSSTTFSDQALKQSLQGLAGYHGTNFFGTVIRNPPPFTEITFEGTFHEGNGPRYAVKDFYVPIPLSTTFYLKDNLQTRMLEDLEVVVKTRLAPTQYKMQGGIGPNNLPWTDRHELTLSADFINFHENVEEVIRNENFKPNVPAMLLSSDQLLYKAKYTTSKTIGSSQEHSYSVPLDTDALVTDIYVVPKIRVSNHAFERHIGPLQTAFEFELFSGGESLFRGSKVEFDGYPAANYTTVTRQYQTEGILPMRWSRCGTHIRLGLNNTDEYFDGGISFQSLINPTLVIRATMVPGEAYQFTDMQDDGVEQGVNLNASKELLEFDVVLKRKVMLRIDGNTGKIAKSLES